jgi:hypothetical protein
MHISAQFRLRFAHHKMPHLSACVPNTVPPSVKRPKCSPLSGCTTYTKNRYFFLMLTEFSQLRAVHKTILMWRINWQVRETKRLGPVWRYHRSMQPEILTRTYCPVKTTEMRNVRLPNKSCPSQHKSTLAASGHAEISNTASKLNTHTHLLTCHSHTDNCGKEPAGESDYSATVTITATRWTNQWPTCFNANRACFTSNLPHVFDNTT